MSLMSQIIHSREATNESSFNSFILYMLISHGKEHGNRVHSKTKSFICEECNQSFSTMKCIRKHQRIHEGATTFCCSECNESFSSLGDLNMHKILVHYSVKCVYNCSECDKSFAYHCLLKKAYEVSQ